MNAQVRVWPHGQDWRYEVATPKGRDHNSVASRAKAEQGVISYLKSLGVNEDTLDRFAEVMDASYRYKVAVGVRPAFSLSFVIV